MFIKSAKKRNSRWANQVPATFLVKEGSFFSTFTLAFAQAQFLTNFLNMIISKKEG